jgi:hypothetical protein
VGRASVDPRFGSGKSKEGEAVIVAAEKEVE